jgi:hypothetical protein
LNRRACLLLGATLAVFAASGARAQSLTEEYGYDHAGGDYDSFRARSLGECKHACQRDRRCQAYTFLGRKGECYLKDQVYPSGQSADAITGVKDSQSGGFGGSLSEEVGYDRSGNDYRSFEARNLGDCKRACAAERRCRAYTFLTRTRGCYLKERASDPRPASGSVTGAKDAGGFEPEAGRLTEETGYDRRGDDYTSFRARGLLACQSACRRDSRCLAYTFKSSSGDCYLKSRINSREPDRDAITGYKEGS